MRIVDDGIALGPGERGRLLESLGGLMVSRSGWIMTDPKAMDVRGKVPNCRGVTGGQ